LEACRPRFEALGYQWLGEYGLPERRYCTKSDPATGRRLVNAHCYAQESSEVTRHLAFRDHLRKHPDIAPAHGPEKARCRLLHPEDTHAYTDCKNAWIRKVEADALALLSH